MTTTVYKAYFTMEGEGCLMMVHLEKRHSIHNQTTSRLLHNFVLSDGHLMSCHVA